MIRCEKCDSALVNCYQSMMTFAWHCKCNICKHEFIINDHDIREAKSINYRSMMKEYVGQ